MNRLLAGLIAAVLLAPAASAATYTLDFAGKGTGPIPDTYYDNADADLSFRTVSAGSFGDKATLGTVNFWGTGYGDLPGAAWGLNSPSIAEIRIVATDPTKVVSLLGFDLGGWVANWSAQWRVFDLAWNLLSSGSGTAPQIGRLSVGASGNAVGGLILQWGENAWGVGVQNVAYSVEPRADIAAVPLPAALPLALLGLGALAVIGRKRRA